MNGRTSNGSDYRTVFQKAFKSMVDMVYKEQEEELSKLLAEENLKKDEEERMIERLKKNIESTENSIAAIKRSKDIQRKSKTWSTLGTQVSPDDIRNGIKTIEEQRIKSERVEGMEDPSTLVSRILDDLITVIQNDGNLQSYHELVESATRTNFSSKPVVKLKIIVKDESNRTARKTSKPASNRNNVSNIPEEKPAIEVVTIDDDD